MYISMHVCVRIHVCASVCINVYMCVNVYAHTHAPATSLDVARIQSTFFSNISNPNPQPGQ